MKIGWVHCKVSLGFFDTEFYVSVGNASAHIYRGNVRVATPPTVGADVDGEVLTYVIEERQEEALVELPGEPVVGGLRNWVPKSSLVAV